MYDDNSYVSKSLLFLDSEQSEEDSGFFLIFQKNTVVFIKKK